MLHIPTYTHNPKALKPQSQVKKTIFSLVATYACRCLLQASQRFFFKAARGACSDTSG